MNVGDKDSEQPLTEGYYGERDAATGAWHGLGVRTFSDGRQYAGQWEHGAMNGLGRLQGPWERSRGARGAHGHGHG